LVVETDGVMVPYRRLATFDCTDGWHEVKGDLIERLVQLSAADTPT
jgi:hypothetical protein